MLATSLGLLLLLGGALAGPVPDCGPPPAPLNATVPNVLLIGDSSECSHCCAPSLLLFPCHPSSAALTPLLALPPAVSMGTGGDKYPDGSYIPLGYGWDVRDALEPVGLASVQHNGGWLLAGQAGASSRGAACIDRWLGSGPWDIVHVNFGLHDIDSSEFVPPANYTSNLELIYSRIVPKLTAKGQLIWASSSPVPYPSEYKLRNNSAVQHGSTALGHQARPTRQGFGRHQRSLHPHHPRLWRHRSARLVLELQPAANVVGPRRPPFPTAPAPRLAAEARQHGRRALQCPRSADDGPRDGIAHLTAPAYPPHRQAR